MSYLYRCRLNCQAGKVMSPLAFWQSYEDFLLFGMTFTECVRQLPVTSGTQSTAFTARLLAATRLRFNVQFQNMKSEQLCNSPSPCLVLMFVSWWISGLVTNAIEKQDCTVKTSIENLSQDGMCMSCGRFCVVWSTLSWVCKLHASLLLIISFDSCRINGLRVIFVCSFISHG